MQQEWRPTLIFSMFCYTIFYRLILVFGRRDVNMFHRQNKGFTLIELLIVVAIIGILAAIAVPNFLNAQIRAKVAKVLTDIDTIGKSQEMYRVDWNTYTENHHDSDVPLHAGLYRLTSPVSYIGALPQDPFYTNPFAQSDSWGKLQKHYTFGSEPDWEDKWNRGGNPNGNASRWRVASAGPSFSDDSNPVFEYPGYQRTQWDTNGRFSAEGYSCTFRYMRYHPSNGLKSVGDILVASDWKPAYLKTPRDRGFSNMKLLGLRGIVLAGNDFLNFDASEMLAMAGFFAVIFAAF
ncbi:prepilin-type N-terminal cleavage/methylation domain-containing protein [bacterium]|nr:prepilin-type N-terminal cleavage/methylation domain-containing protein [bacterium]